MDEKISDKEEGGKGGEEVNGGKRGRKCVCSMSNLFPLPRSKNVPVTLIRHGSALTQQSHFLSCVQTDNAHRHTHTKQIHLLIDMTGKT